MTNRLTKPLVGWRVLVPRGGPWGDQVAANLRAKGAHPIVAPMINFAATDDAPALDAALTRLAAGGFDWMTITSATTVDVLSSHRAVVAPGTRIAAVGETTAAALVAAGYHVDIVPSEDNSARGLLEEWEAATAGVIPLRVLTLRSEIAKPLLSEGLRRAGHTDLADRIDRELVGRNVLQGRWTFQIMEEYDDGYYATFKELERVARDELVGGRRHLYEAEMKEDRRSPGDPGHEAVPHDDGPQSR